MRTNWTPYAVVGATVAALWIGTTLFDAPTLAQNDAAPAKATQAEAKSTQATKSVDADIATLVAAAPVVEKDAYDRIMAKLEERTTFDFKDTKLDDVIELFETKHHLPIQIDRKSLEEAAFDTATPMTKRVVDLPLRHALRSLFGEYNLAYVVADDSLRITTKTAMENHSITRVYAVGDLVAHTDGDPETDAFLSLIQFTIQPNTWKSNGGQGDCLFHRGRSMIVMNTQEVQEQVSDLLDQLRRAEAAQPAGVGAHGRAAAAPGDEKTLVRRVYPLRESDQASVRTPRAAEAAALTDPPAVVPAPLVDLSADVSRSVDPRWIHTVQMGGVGCVIEEGQSGGGVGGCMGGMFPSTGPKHVSPEHTAILVKQIVRPESWNVPETRCLAGSSSLIVVQTPEVQREVLKFLKELQVLRGDVIAVSFGSCRTPEGSAAF